MGKIGSYPYPDISLPKARIIAKKIVSEFGNSSVEKETAAGLLGHSTATSGGFSGKITALRRYGLGEGWGRIKMTKLAQKLATPKDRKEEEKMMEKALRNVELFDKILAKFGANPPKEKFWVKLSEITDAERAECEEKAINIHKLFIEGAKDIKLEKKETEGELELGGAITQWKVIVNALKLDFYASETGFEKRKPQVFDKLKSLIKNTDFDKTKLVIESYSDVLGGDGTKVTEKMSGRILSQLADDLGIEREGEEEILEKDEVPER